MQILQSFLLLNGQILGADRHTVIELGLHLEQCRQQGLHFLELRRLRRSQVVGLAEVFVDVVELPLVARDHIGRRRTAEFPGQGCRCRGGDPSVMVDGAVAEHFEVLHGMLLRCASFAKRINKACSFNRILVNGVLEEQFVMTDLNAESASAIAQLKGDNWKAIELADGKLLLLFTKQFKFRNTTADVYPDLPKANAEIVTELNYMHWDHWNDEFVDHLNFAIYDGKAVLEGKDIMGEEAFDASDFTASPDGKHIVYSSKKVRGTAYATSTNTDIYLYEIATGKTTNLTENEHSCGSFCSA